MRPREDFGSVMQYKKYLLACEYAEKIIKFQNKGYLIIEPDGSTMKGTMTILIDHEWAAIGEVYDGCTMALIAFAYGDDNIPWIEETIKEIHEIFREYKCIKPKHIHNIIIKNPKYKKLKLGDLL